LSNVNKRPALLLTFDKSAPQNGSMARQKQDLLQGTLDMLILQTLALAPMHGWGISLRIQQVSQDVLRVNQGSLYPALHRLEQQGWIDSEWDASENNRQAKYYRLTRAGRRQLTEERENWARMTDAVTRILQTQEP
jgi:PadR family transcriptional regulator